MKMRCQNVKLFLHEHLDPGKVRLELAKTLLLRPDIQWKRNQLVDVGNPSNLQGQVDAVKVAPTSVTGDHLDVVKGGCRIVRYPFFFILPTGCAFSSRK